MCSCHSDWFYCWVLAYPTSSCIWSLVWLTNAAFWYIFFVNLLSFLYKIQHLPEEDPAADHCNRNSSYDSCVRKSIMECVYLMYSLDSFRPGRMYSYIPLDRFHTSWCTFHLVSVPPENAYIVYNQRWCWFSAIARVIAIAVGCILIGLYKPPNILNMYFT